MPTIRVEGQSQVTAEPDEIQLELTVSSSGEVYGKVIDDLDRKVGSLKDAFRDCGVERTAIKSQDFSISVGSEYDEHLQKRRFVGYDGLHTLVVRLPMDRTLLNALLAVCPKSEATPNIVISFQVRDQEGLQRRALQEAIAAARRNAELIAAASQCVLGELVEVVYGDRHSSNPKAYWIRQEPGHVDYCAASYANEIEPEPVEASEKVSVTWYLKP